MRVLIVYAHPAPRSFNGALKDVAIEALTGAGHDVQVSDLYAMRFGAVLGSEDFRGDRVDPDFLDISKEQTAAFEQKTFAPEILAEQEKVAWAELVVFQFPMWWYGMPAILKGWVDRVFARGFAYAAGRKYDTGLLGGRLAMVSTTTGTSAATYMPDGIDGAVETVLWPIHNGMFRYTGFDVLPPHIAYMPGRVDAEQRKAYLASFAKRLLTIDSTPRLFFHPLGDYGPDERLRPGVLARSGIQRNI